MRTAKHVPRRQMCLMLDPDVRRKLRQVAANEERQMSDIANDALRAALGLQRDPKPAA
jgi:predicted transcriptional regulator